MVATLMTSSTISFFRLRTPSTSSVNDLCSMYTTPMARPILSRVRLEKSRAPLPSRVMNTAGEPLCWSMPDAASVMYSPVSMTLRWRTIGRPLRSW